MSRDPKFVPLEFTRYSLEDMQVRAVQFMGNMNRRRTTRHFSAEPVPRELIEHAVRTASTAPSGAHQQPWTFVVVDDPSLKQRIREAAEREEAINYAGRMSREWLEAVAPLGTDEIKPHLTEAPYVVVLLLQRYRVRSDGQRVTHYYAVESCGIAAGFFIAAVHWMGLVTLTHTPSPMGFLRRLLNRPETEKPFLVMPVGYPAADARVPALQRKPLESVIRWNDGT